MNIYDVLLLFFLAANISSGIQKGFVYQLASVAEIIFSMYITYLLMNFSLNDFFFSHSFLLTIPYSKAIVFLVIFVILRIVVHFLGHLISIAWKLNSDSIFDSVSGGFLGAVQGISEIFILMIAIGFFRPVTALAFLSGSKMLPVLNGIALDCFQRLTNFFLM